VWDEQAMPVLVFSQTLFALELGLALATESELCLVDCVNMCINCSFFLH